MTLHFAWRNLWRHPRRTWLTASAIAFSATLLIFMITLQLGSYDMMIDSTLRVFTGQMQVQRTGYLDKPQLRTSIGRTQDNDLRVVDPTISRLHAVLKVNGQDVTVIDANSRNGVYVNGIQVRHSRLNDGDMLTFGSVRFRYRVGSGSSGGG